MMKRAVFLDKDGTLIENVPYNVDVAQIRLLPRSGEGLRALHAAGYELFVVSNQSGVARGYFLEEALGAVEARLRELLAAEGVPLAGFRWCPHYPQGVVQRYAVTCLCRKPAPGMLLQIRDEFGISLADSWLVGDILDDIEAGNRAGCRTILLDNGNETVWQQGEGRQPHHLAADLNAAAAIILGQQQGRYTS